jgi:hypothetical protein
MVTRAYIDAAVIGGGNVLGEFHCVEGESCDYSPYCSIFYYQPVDPYPPVPRDVSLSATVTESSAR